MRIPARRSYLRRSARFLDLEKDSDRRLTSENPYWKKEIGNILVRLRNNFRLTIVVLLAASGIAITTSSVAGATRHPGKPELADSSGQLFLRQVGDVTFPAPYANSTNFDISYVDSTTQTYYLADKTNGGIDAINAASDTFGSVVGVGDFAGANTGASVATPAQVAACGAHGTGGPNGVLSLDVDGVRQLVGGDGVTAAKPASSVKIFTLSTPTTGTLGATVSANGTTGSCRSDEMAYDSPDHLLVVANDLDSPPYVSFISIHADPSLDAVIGQVKFPSATGGIEQLVFDLRAHLFYVNIPGVDVAVLDPHTMAVTTTYPTPNCTASGLALDENTQQLLLSCGTNTNGVEIMNARSGQIVNNIPQVSGADEVWFDPGTNNYYLAASGMTSSGSAASAVTTTGSGTGWTLAETGATGGTFTLTAGTATTAPIAANASAASVESALAAVVPGTTVSGGPLPALENVTFPAAQTTFASNVAGLTPAGYLTPVLGAISAGSSRSWSPSDGQASWLENVPTPTTANAHSVAADAVNGQVFVPISGQGVAVFAWAKS